jgi:hypothetical protein
MVGFAGPAGAAPALRHCRTLALIDNGVGLNNQEQGLPVMLYTPSAGWRALWPRLRHLG